MYVSKVLRNGKEASVLGKREELNLSIANSPIPNIGKLWLRQTASAKTSQKGNELRRMGEGSYTQLPGRQGKGEGGREEGGSSQHVSSCFFYPFRPPWEVWTQDSQLHIF